jgi:hypothetical protein
MDLVTPKNVAPMAAMWAAMDFTKPLPSPF